ncbi:NUDIX domain-containing protein [Cupriavidus basilensis]|uniref:NUDIX domain-containing protein n=1 Tax=Cupriavidus basilensis TaxID=68895 RepID=UPI0023E78E68|nr:NUDIX domain-containing protein [Cupriavidus basilensis]MDF3883372.1 NUDIX domain-containing protein [Cupriavidus basilensis]
MTAIKRSAGLVVMRQFDGRWRCLVLRAYRNWAFPKGQPEPGEELLQTALRETTEETGLSGLELPWGEDYRETEPYSEGKVARLYLALSSQGEVSLPVSAERATKRRFRVVVRLSHQYLVSFLQCERLPHEGCQQIHSALSLLPRPDCRRRLANVQLLQIAADYS